MKVLGIDPGSHRTGWGIVLCEGSRLSHVASGVVTARAEALAERLLSIADGLEALLAAHRPEAVAVETVFFAKNSQSALALGQARGVALLCAARAGLPVFEYTAGQIKQATTGRGRADKQQVQAMLGALLGVGEGMALDESDALAAAICHAQLYATPAARFLREAQAESRRPERRRRG